MEEALSQPDPEGAVFVPNAGTGSLIRWASHVTALPVPNAEQE